MDLRGRGEIEGFYIGSYEQRDDIEEIREIISHNKSIYKPTSIMLRTKMPSGNIEWQTFPA
jgi:transketolase